MNQKGSVLLSLIIVIILIAATGAGIYLVQHPQILKSRASEAVKTSDKYPERVVFTLDSPSQIYSSWTSDIHNQQLGSNLPSSVSFNGAKITIADQGGIVIKNRNPEASFYKVEVTMSDSGQSNIQTYITAIDQLWGNGVNTNGFSAGIDTKFSPNTYYYQTTEMKHSKDDSSITKEQEDFSVKALDKFLSRSKNSDIKIELYFTPIGDYAVINGANYGSFPRLYIGSYIYKNKVNKPINYFALSKINPGGDSITFKDFKITQLSDNIKTIDDANAYFLLSAVNNPALQADLASSPTPCPKDPKSNIRTENNVKYLTYAYIYRTYDYYFKTDSTPIVRSLIDKYLACAPDYINENIARYGHGDTNDINHDFINHMAGAPYFLYAISDYATDEQIKKLHDLFWKVVSTSMQYIKTDGSFPANSKSASYYADRWRSELQRWQDWKNQHNGIEDSNLRPSYYLGKQYIGDNLSDEIEWLLTIYTFYYANFPGDPNSDKVLDYITYLGFILHSDGQTMRQVYGNSVKFKYLPDDFLDSSTQTIWPDGLTDHHALHPNVDYAQGSVGLGALDKNILQKIGVTIPTISRNLDKVYQASVKNYVDIQNFSLLKPALKFDEDYTKYPQWSAEPHLVKDYYEFDPKDGSIIRAVPYSNPSLQGDWCGPEFGYATQELVGDFDTALSFAKNVYYFQYSGAGNLFCGGRPTANPPSFVYAQALNATLGSMRSNFKLWEDNFFKAKVWAGTLDGYNEDPTQRNWHWQYDTQDKKVGSSSIKLTSSSGCDCEVYSPLIKVEPGQNYQVSYWVKTDNLQSSTGQVVGRVIAAQFNSSALEGDTENRIDSGFNSGTNLTGTNDWVQKSYVFQTSPTTSFVRLRLPLGLNGTASGTVHFDDVKITKTSAPVQTPAPVVTPSPVPTSAPVLTTQSGPQVSAAAVSASNNCLSYSTTSVTILQGRGYCLKYSDQDHTSYSGNLDIRGVDANGNPTSDTVISIQATNGVYQTPVDVAQGLRSGSYIFELRFPGTNSLWSNPVTITIQ